MSLGNADRSETSRVTVCQVEIVEAERDLRVGYGSREAIDTLLNEKRLIVRRPVLSKFQPTSTLVENIRCFFGEPKLIELPMSTPTVTVIEEFCCGDAVCIFFNLDETFLYLDI